MLFRLNQVGAAVPAIPHQRVHLGYPHKLNLALCLTISHIIQTASAHSRFTDTVGVTALHTPPNPKLNSDSYWSSRVTRTVPQHESEGAGLARPLHIPEKIRHKTPLISIPTNRWCRKSACQLAAVKCNERFRITLKWGSWRILASSAAAVSFTDRLLRESKTSVTSWTLSLRTACNFTSSKRSWAYRREHLSMRHDPWEWGEVFLQKRFRGPQTSDSVL